MAIEIELNLDLYKEAELTRNIPAGQSIIVNEITKQNFIFGSVEFFVYAKITAQQILVPIQDPPPAGAETGIGNLGAEMVDNNFSSISYNNFGAATPVNLPFYTFDFGVPVSVDRFQFRWWQFNQYVPNDFRIEASNDNTNWTTIKGGLNGTNVVGNVQDVDTDSTAQYQYWRMFVLSGEGGLPFIVVTQIIPQTAGTVFESIESSSSVNFFFDGSGRLNIENLNTVDTELTVRYKEETA